MRKKPRKEPSYLMIGKCLYFPKNEILVFGDLHLGYEDMLHERGVLIPLRQLRETKEELGKVFGEIEKRGMKVKKIVILGDIKHNFSYQKEEKFEIFELFDFLRKYVNDKNIIVIRGNHDKIDLGRKFLDYYIEEDICFVHGHKDFPEIWNKKIKMIILGHDHPGVTISDKQAVKKEKYKCFLVGKRKSKKIIMLPSFFGFFDGSEFLDFHEDFSIIPRDKLRDFEVFVVNQNLEEEALGFGKLKQIA